MQPSEVHLGITDTLGREMRVRTLSAHDVAAALRDRLRDMGVVKVHKLLYYVQGWHLVMTGEPAFEEEIHAWANGPVVAEMWADEKHGRTRRRQAQPLTDAHVKTIEYVVSRYGRLTGKALIRLTHQEDPWRNAVETDDEWASEPKISKKALVRWFEQDEEFRTLQQQVTRLRERAQDRPFGNDALAPHVAAAIEDARARRSQVADARPG